MDKRALRRACFARIRALSESEKDSASESICNTLESIAGWKAVETVFSFLPLPSEPNLTPLFHKFPEKHWGFSRVSSDGERLIFHHVRSEEELREGDYGLLEPDPSQCPVLDNPDWILIPGVGFSRENLARLGRGKGHYDRYLSSLETAGRMPKKLGICFSTQFCAITPEAHDVPMDRIVSESG